MSETRLTECRLSLSLPLPRHLAPLPDHQTLEDDLLQIHEVFRSSLQLLVTLTGHLNVGLQRCTAGRRRSKSVSLGTAGLPNRGSRGLSLVGGHAAQNGEGSWWGYGLEVV